MYVGRIPGHVPVYAGTADECAKKARKAADSVKAEFAKNEPGFRVVKWTVQDGTGQVVTSGYEGLENESPDIAALAPGWPPEDSPRPEPSSAPVVDRTDRED